MLQFSPKQLLQHLLSDTTDTTNGRTSRIAFFSSGPTFSRYRMSALSLKNFQNPICVIAQEKNGIAGTEESKN